MISTVPNHFRLVNLEIFSSKYRLLSLCGFSRFKVVSNWYRTLNMLYTGKKIEVILAFQIAKIREAVPKTHNHVDPSTICTHFNTFCFLRYIIKSVFSLLYNTF
jgi:hypothetical protein